MKAWHSGRVVIYRSKGWWFAPRLCYLVFSGHGALNVKLRTLECFTLYLRNRQSWNLRAIESCVCIIRSMARNMTSFFWTVHCTKNSKQIFPEMKLRGQVHNFYIHLSVNDFYIPMSVRLFAVLVWRSLIRSLEYINRSQIQECRNWKQGSAVSFLGIFVSNFWYSAFAVYCTFSHLFVLNILSVGHPAEA
jgi:hypothetical protein